MPPSVQAHRKVKTWVPRLWGFALGAGVLVVCAFAAGALFGPGADPAQVVFPYDL